MTIKCGHCGIETENPKYCSKSCAAKESNKIPKRIRIKTCSQCSELTRNYRSTLCEFHFQEEKKNKREYLMNLTLQDYCERENLKNLLASSKFANVRGLNRSWNKDMTKLPCAHCGYDKHVELAHIRAFTSFPLTAKLSEVNGKENIIQLCPNCHWEFDNGLIQIEELRQNSHVG